MNSKAFSKVIFIGGTNLTASSAPDDLVLVSFLPLHTFISISSALPQTPTIIPWYTGTPASMNNDPLS